MSIQYIAVNKKTKAVFLADYNAFATGKKYSVYINYVSINQTNKSEPFLQWVYKSTSVVYQSDYITGISVDAKDNLLIIADSQINKIVKLDLTADKIDNKTGLVIPNPNKLQSVTSKVIQGLGGLSVDVPTQRIFYNSFSNQLGGPAGLT